jgi:1,4-dihydroxy-2-naphthoyl-CoA synthase
MMSNAAGQAAAVHEGSADAGPAVTVEKRGHVLLIGLNRPKKLNAFNVDLIERLARAYHRVENDPDIRCGVVFGHGKHFTGGAWTFRRSDPGSKKASSISRGPDCLTHGARPVSGRHRS